ncbi:SDR family oxidoreductase [Nocardia sp. 2]|uniref:SDR family oxidoreductase n=1 Tax=Nocardia acididurans TaxID=2802282 RepID=A0ABS1M860_9NOCA|nr:SDR family oxidoreductase [Nocardia acididurans]MBL1076754.1 SDR family oxidoreductase [Nocardia acididurans]
MDQLRGQRILVTGVSRPGGIGAAIAEHCARAGAAVLTHGLPEYDRQQRYPDADGLAGSSVAAQLRGEGLEVSALRDGDLAEPEEPGRIFAQVRDEHEIVDGLVVDHAYSVAEDFGAWTAANIDRHLAVNVRASMLLVQEFAAALPKGRGGSIVLLTSGQYLGPMAGEIAYAVSKEAVRGVCTQASAALAPRGIRVNCVNPGPTDTGYAPGAAWELVRQRFPTGRWGEPRDAARLVRFLLSPDAEWITGQTIAAEGGFVR